MVLVQKQNYRSMEQDKIPKINTCTSGKLIFEKGRKNIQWKKKIQSLQKVVLGKLDSNR